MRTITYDETKYKLVPIDPATDPEPEKIPRAMALYYELAGIDADIEFGGLQAFDEVCLRTLRRVMLELREIGQEATRSQNA